MCIKRANYLKHPAGLWNSDCVALGAKKKNLKTHYELPETLLLPVCKTLLLRPSMRTSGLQRRKTLSRISVTGQFYPMRQPPMMRQASWSDQSLHSQSDFWHTTGPFESVHQSPTEIHPNLKSGFMEGPSGFGGRMPRGEGLAKKRQEGAEGERCVRHTAGVAAGSGAGAGDVRLHVRSARAMLGGDVGWSFGGS